MSPEHSLFSLAIVTYASELSNIIYSTGNASESATLIVSPANTIFTTFLGFHFYL